MFSGEDRWLCTLLLQQGYRVEYCAASDALTYAPEDFKEFYNQRRRWGPSTMANMIDLLSSFKSTVHKNDNISFLYMFYQMMIFCSSILGPGTTLMMVAGSFNAVLGTNLWQSYIMALGPITFFVVVCFTTRGDTQIIVAGVLSSLYAIVMMVVIIATLVNAFQESLTSPNVIFMLCLVGSFVGSGILHPQEMFSLVHGFIYFICIPSGYLILPIYSLCNMNVVSWGTREVAQKKSREELENEKKEEEERQKAAAAKSSGLMTWLGLDALFGEIKEFYSTMLGRKQEIQENKRIKELEEQVKEMEEKEEEQKKQNELQKSLTGQKEAPSTVQKKPDKNAPPPPPPPRKKVIRDELVNPAWIEDERIGNGRQETISRRETAFWRQLIRFHLHPLDKDKKKEAEIQDQLKQMRTNIVFGYLMVNFLWMVVIFQLQLLKDVLDEDFFIPIPRYDDPYGEPERFEPLGLAFLLVFGTTLTMQFSATLVHRWVTFMHVIARTEIWTTHNTVEGKLKLAEKMQAIGTIPELDEDFDLPPPDYEEESIYQTIPPEGYSQRNPNRVHRYDADSTYRRHGGPSRRADRFNYERRMRVQHRRPREFGQVPVSADVLQRNFNRRFNALQKAKPHDHVMDMDRGGRRRSPTRRPQGNMDQIYRTVRMRPNRDAGRSPRGPRPPPPPGGRGRPTSRR